MSLGFRYASPQCVEYGYVRLGKVNTGIYGECTDSLDAQEWNTMKLTVRADSAEVKVNERVVRMTLLRMSEDHRAAGGIVIRRYHGYDAYFRKFKITGKSNHR